MRYTSVFLLALSLLLFSCQSDNSDLPTTPQPAQTDALSPNNQGELGIVRPVDPGPPASITIGELSEPGPAGENGYGAALVCSLAVRVRDAEGFLVEGAIVCPEVIPSGTTSVYLGPGQLATNQYGIVYFHLFYNSESTYGMFDFIARCFIPEDTVETIAENLVLPLYGGELTLNVIPESWTWAQFNPAVLKVLPTLHDDFCHTISNGLIHFENSLGLFFCTDSAEAAGPLENGWLYNGNWVSECLTGSNGQAALFMRAEMFTNYSVTPPYPGVFVNETQIEIICQVSCTVVGEDVASDPVNLTFRRVLQ